MRVAFTNEYIGIAMRVSKGKNYTFVNKVSGSTAGTLDHLDHEESSHQLKGMNMMNQKGVILSAWLWVICFGLACGQATAETNVAMSGEAKASSVHSKKYSAEKAIDGKIDDDHRWVSADGNGPHKLEINFAAEFTVSGAHLYSGFHSEDPIRDFKLEYWKDQKWVSIRGAAVRGNEDIARLVPFDSPVTTTRIRFVSTDRRVRVKELLLWLDDGKAIPPLGTGVKGGPVAPPETHKHHVLANQVGYDTAGPKRFTAPLSPDGSAFTLTTAGSSQALFRGEIRDRVGDFSAFSPKPSTNEYVIHVTGEGLEAGVSYPFQINPLHMERLVLEPALRFMVDARSMVGTHPSAYGGTPWRDGVYYTHEMPSMVMMYLAHPAFFDQAEVEINWHEDKARFLSPDYKWVRAAIDKDVFNSTKLYYTKLDAPRGQSIPDVVQMIHWTVGMYMIDPVTKDPSHSGGAEKIFPQTIEQFAFYLYAHPYMQEYFTDRFHQQAVDFTLKHWESVGLLDVITEYGDAKGRKAPGHSVMPNLLMYEVAKRDNLPNPDRYLEAAVKQAEWVIKTFKANDPRVGKGQRMSEHKTVTGLTMLQRVYPEHAPKGLSAWLRDWQLGVIAASENHYDFRRYSDTTWTLPKPWNEPGNIAGLPGLIDAVVMAEDPDSHLARLIEIRTAHIDNLFGRNPMNATSSQRGAVDYPGIDNVWPKKFHEDWCARLELVRGTLNSNAATEHFPFTPQNGFRHCEGWTAFNAAWNVALAYRCRYETRFELLDSHGHPMDVVKLGEPVQLVMRAVMNQDAEKQETMIAWIQASDRVREIDLQEQGTNSLLYEASFSPNEIGLRAGQDVVIGYGFGFMARELRLTWDPAQKGWKVSRD